MYSIHWKSFFPNDTSKQYSKDTWKIYEIQNDCENENIYTV